MWQQSIQSWQSIMSPWQRKWLKSMVTQQLCVVDPELGIFIAIICLHHPGRAEWLVSETAGRHLFVTASVTFYCRVYVLLNIWQNAVQRTTEASLTQTCAVHPAVGSDPLFQLLSVQPFWCTPECSCCVHADLCEPHSWPERLWV